MERRKKIAIPRGKVGKVYKVKDEIRKGFFKREIEIEVER